jgi:hypothetical protein
MNLCCVKNSVKIGLVFEEDRVLYLENEIPSHGPSVIFSSPCTNDNINVDLLNQLLKFKNFQKLSQYFQ